MVFLSDLVDALDGPDGMLFFYDREADSIIGLSPYDSGSGARVIHDSLEKGECRFVLLMKDSEFDVASMHGFAIHLGDSAFSRRLLDAIGGRSAVRSFRLLISGSEYEADWLEFRRQRLEDEARQWCRANLVRFK